MQVKTAPVSETRPETLFAEQFAAAIAWWRESGVDSDFRDDPTAWLRGEDVETPQSERSEMQPKPLAAELALREKAIEPVGGNPENWPTDLATFREWWLAEVSLDTGGIGPRVAPRGPAKAEIMILVSEPEVEDREILLSGPGGRLLGNMLHAMGVDGEKAYIASALPRHTPLPDWQSLGERELGRLIAHHAALVAPERLLVFGRNILPLLGHGMTQSPAEFRKFQHDSLRIPAMAGPGLPQILRLGAERARFWRRWLKWTDGEND